MCDVPSTEIVITSPKAEDKAMGSTKAKSPSSILGIGHDLSYPAIKANSGGKGLSNVGGFGWTTLIVVGYILNPT